MASTRTRDGEYEDDYLLLAYRMPKVVLAVPPKLPEAPPLRLLLSPPLLLLPPLQLSTDAPCQLPYREE